MAIGSERSCAVLLGNAIPALLSSFGFLSLIARLEDAINVSVFVDTDESVPGTLAGAVGFSFDCLLPATIFSSLALLLTTVYNHPVPSNTTMMAAIFHQA